ncbi:MAG: hypothetical protein NC452_21145 [Eubacterium sp.]|nr:hypothetical protein [Eubacterium sp.]
MMNLKELEETYEAVVDVVNNCPADDSEAASNAYHIVKLLRSTIRDWPEHTARLDEMYSVLDTYAARLKRQAGGKIGQWAMTSTDKNTKSKHYKINTPLSNAHVSVILLIRQRLKKENTLSLVSLHRIANFYTRRLFEYSDMIDKQIVSDELFFIHTALYSFAVDIGNHTGYLEALMTREGIQFTKIKV